MASPARTQRLRGWARSLALVSFFGVWGVALLLIGSILMGAHWIGLPAPAHDDARLASALAGLNAPGDERWQLTHVLYAECRCSARIFDYLCARPTPRGAGERVLLVGRREEWVARARAHGIDVRVVTAEELKSRFDVESAPLLLVSDPRGAIRYVGGYTEQKQGLDYRDVAVLASLRSGQAVDELPVYGCGVSPELQRQLDPIGIEYPRPR